MYHLTGLPASRAINIFAFAHCSLCTNSATSSKFDKFFLPNEYYIWNTLFKILMLTITCRCAKREGMSLLLHPITITKQVFTKSPVHISLPRHGCHMKCLTFRLLTLKFWLECRNSDFIPNLNLDFLDISEFILRRRPYYIVLLLFGMRSRYNVKKSIFEHLEKRYINWMCYYYYYYYYYYCIFIFFKKM